MISLLLEVFQGLFATEVVSLRRGSGVTDALTGHNEKCLSAAV